MRQGFVNIGAQNIIVFSHYSINYIRIYFYETVCFPCLCTEEEDQWLCLSFHMNLVGYILLYINSTLYLIYCQGQGKVDIPPLNYFVYQVQGNFSICFGVSLLYSSIGWCNTFLVYM